MSWVKAIELETPPASWNGEVEPVGIDVPVAKESGSGATSWGHPPTFSPYSDPENMMQKNHVYKNQSWYISSVTYDYRVL